MSELEQTLKMMNNAQVWHEVDEETYPNRIIIRVYRFSYADMKRRIETIFSFDLSGNLTSIG